MIGVDECEETVDEDISEEARVVIKKRHCDKPPTQRERDDHRRLHLPYRTWCPECVAGRGRDARLLKVLPMTIVSCDMAQEKRVHPC